MAETDRPANEHLLKLTGGGVLAYAHGGNENSKDLVIYFHGAFGVGALDSTPLPVLEERQVRCLNPTLPGWGESTPTPPDTAFHIYLYQIMTELINHLYSDTTNLRIYLSGGSFGTVISQMLYGAPYDQFPLGHNIVGMLLLAPFSPPHVHHGFNQCLSFPNYLMVGAPGRYLPFKLVPRLARVAMQRKMDTREHAETFIREFAFTKMSPGERKACDAWKTRRDIKDGEEGKKMADGVYRSVRTSWAGFMALPEIMQSDWGGYNPSQLDNEHSKPVLIVVTHGDWETKKMGEWLGKNLKNAHVRYEEGGHVATMFVMEDIWADFMARVDPAPVLSSQ